MHLFIKLLVPKDQKRHQILNIPSELFVEEPGEEKTEQRVEKAFVPQDAMLLLLGYVPSRSVSAAQRTNNPANESL